MLDRDFFTCGLPPQASDMLQLALEEHDGAMEDSKMRPHEWRVLIPAAATWLIEAGRTIYAHCLRNENEDRQASAEVRMGWRGRTWSRQRWACWKIQLQKFGEREDINHECRNLAAQAIRTMKGIDSLYVTVQEWGILQRAATDDNDHVQAINALVSLLEEQASPTDAAKEITSAYEVWLRESAKPTEHLYSNKVYYFFSFYFIDAIEAFGDVKSRDLLIELLKEISERPDVKDIDGSLKKHESGAVYWRDLPTWPFAFGYDALGLNEEYTLGEMDDYLGQGPRLLNVSIFGATMLARGRVFVGLPLEASSALKCGLELENEAQGCAKEYQWKLMIPVSTSWLLIAGECIHSHCVRDSVESTDESDEANDEWSETTWSIER